MSIDLVGNRNKLFLFSGVLLVIAIVALAIPPMLRPGIEFTAGSTTLLHFQKTVHETDLRDAYAKVGHGEARIQSTGPNEFLIRTNELHVPPGSFSEVAPEPQAGAGKSLGTTLLGADAQASGEVALVAGVGGSVCQTGAEVARYAAGTEVTVIERHDECKDTGSSAVLRVSAPDGKTGNVIESRTHDFVAAGKARGTAGGTQQNLGERSQIESALRERFGGFDVLEFASVSAAVSHQAVRNAAVAVTVASLFIMAYVAFAFSSMPQPFRFGACAIIALLHDVVFTLGMFSIFGKVLGTEVNLMFITGLLTVIGFSVHDTIVVFDRIRENVRLYPQAPFAENVNTALIQTLGRSLNTSITVLLTVVAMLVLGGATIQSFLLVLLVGITAGTYSSVAIASQLLVTWDEWDRRRRARSLPAVSAPEA